MNGTPNTTPKTTLVCYGCKQDIHTNAAWISPLTGLGKGMTMPYHQRCVPLVRHG